MTHPTDPSKNTPDSAATATTPAPAGLGALKIALMDGQPRAGMSTAAALGGMPLDLAASQAFTLNPFDLATELGNEHAAIAESTVPFVEPDANAGQAGVTVYNGLPSPIVCVEINLATGQTVRVTPQESIEQLRAFAAAARQNTPIGHLVLEHPPAADPLTQELAQAQIDYSRHRTNLPKIDPSQPPAFF